MGIIMSTELWFTSSPAENEWKNRARFSAELATASSSARKGGGEEMDTWTYGWIEIEIEIEIERDKREREGRERDGEREREREREGKRGGEKGAVRGSEGAS